MEHGGWLVDVVVGHVAVAQSVFDKASMCLLRRVVLLRLGVSGPLFSYSLS